MLNLHTESVYIFFLAENLQFRSQQKLIFTDAYVCFHNQSSYTLLLQFVLQNLSKFKDGYQKSVNTCHGFRVALVLREVRMNEQNKRINTLSRPSTACYCHARKPVPGSYPEDGGGFLRRAPSSSSADFDVQVTCEITSAFNVVAF